MTFRNAERKDTPLILEFIKELADYEHMLDEVVADAVALNGGALTGISQASTFTFRSALSQCPIGRFTALPAIH